MFCSWWIWEKGKVWQIWDTLYHCKSDLVIIGLPWCRFLISKKYCDQHTENTRKKLVKRSSAKIKKFSPNKIDEKWYDRWWLESGFLGFYLFFPCIGVCLKHSKNMFLEDKGAYSGRFFHLKKPILDFWDFSSISHFFNFFHLFHLFSRILGHNFLKILKNF